MAPKSIVTIAAVIAIGFSSFSFRGETIGVKYKLPATGDILYPTSALPCESSNLYQCTVPIPERNDEVLPIFHDNGSPYLRD